MPQISGKQSPWLMAGKCGINAHTPMRSRQKMARVTKNRWIGRIYESSGDQAGSDAKPGVGTRCSLRPEISTE